MNELAYAKHIGDCLAHSESSMTAVVIFTQLCPTILGTHNTRDTRYEGTSVESDYISFNPTLLTATTLL